MDKTNWPNPNPRRPFDDDYPDGYLESDNDFLENNKELAILLLEEYMQGLVKNDV